MKLLNRLEPYFKFTPNERKGIIVLLILLVTVSAIRVCLPYLKSEPDIQDLVFDQLEIQSTDQVRTPAYAKKSIKVDNSKSFKIDTTIKLDPNMASLETLLKVGFSEFSAKNLLKYRNKGGKIFSIDDLKKIYGVDSNLIVSLKKQIMLPKKEEKNSFSKKHQIIIEINRANRDTLQIIPCIGAVLSNRIIKYRSQLGGFISLQQLEEVYGIDSNCYKNLLEYLEIDVSRVHKLNLNTTSEKNLYRHPYISKYQACAIVKYRELMEPFTRVDQLIEHHIFTVREFKRLANYLSINEE